MCAKEQAEDDNTKKSIPEELKLSFCKSLLLWSQGFTSLVLQVILSEKERDSLLIVPLPHPLAIKADSNDF